MPSGPNPPIVVEIRTLDGRVYTHDSVEKAEIAPEARALEIVHDNGDSHLYNWDHVVCFSARKVEE